MSSRQTQAADDIRRTDAGAIDVQYYVAKADRLRSDAYWRFVCGVSRRIAAGLRALVRTGEIGTLAKMPD